MGFRLHAANTLGSTAFIKSAAASTRLHSAGGDPKLALWVMTVLLLEPGSSYQKEASNFGDSLEYSTPYSLNRVV